MEKNNLDHFENMPVKLYKIDVSPPARACMMACEIFNVPTEMVNINIMNQEHRTPEYLKLNPLHTVPVLEDGDLIIHDSHAILMYLADNYGEDDSMYPKDSKQRAIVNQKLFFNASIIFPRLRSIIAVTEQGSNTQGGRSDHQSEQLSLWDQLQNTKLQYLLDPNVTAADWDGTADFFKFFDVGPIEKVVQFDGQIHPLEYYYPVLLHPYAAAKDGVRKLTQKMEDEINEAYNFLEEFLYRSKYLAGERMTIADLAAYTTVSTLVYILPLDALKYPKTKVWMKELEVKPICQKYNEQGASAAGRWISSMLK